MIAHGSRLTFSANGTTGSLIPRAVDSVRAIVINELTPFLDVESVSIATDSIWSDPFHSLSNWPYRATVVARTRFDHADIRDVDSIVSHAFYNAAGEIPTVTSNLEPGQGTPDQQTGATLTTVLVLAAIVLVLVVAVKVT